MTAPKELTPFHEDWQHRTVTVPNNGTFRVPRYVVRVDIDGPEPGYSGTHGWQVRYGPKPWKFFSDTLFGTHKRFGTPAESLEKAQRYLFQHWVGNNVRPARNENADKRFPTGMSGVRVLWYVKADQVCVRVDDLEGKPLTTLYVGTHNTVRLLKLIETIEKAKAVRRGYLKQQGKPLPTEGTPDLNKIATEAPLPFRQTILQELITLRIAAAGAIAAAPAAAITQAKAAVLSSAQPTVQQLAHLAQIAATTPNPWTP